jgi:hypothetical protein
MDDFCPSFADQKNTIFVLERTKIGWVATTLTVMIVIEGRFTWTQSGIFDAGRTDK